MERPLALRIKYGFNRVHKPVLDDAPGRSFDSMAEYRAWCQENLPEYLGYKRASGRQKDKIEPPLLENFRMEFEKRRAPPLRTATDIASKKPRHK